MRGREREGFFFSLGLKKEGEKSEPESGTRKAKNRGPLGLCLTKSFVNSDFALTASLSGVHTTIVARQRSANGVTKKSRVKEALACEELWRKNRRGEKNDFTSHIN